MKARLCEDDPLQTHPQILVTGTGLRSGRKRTYCAGRRVGKAKAREEARQLFRVDELLSLSAFTPSGPTIHRIVSIRAVCSSTAQDAYSAMPGYQVGLNIASQLPLSGTHVDCRQQDAFSSQHHLPAVQPTALQLLSQQLLYCCRSSPPLCYSCLAALAHCY